MARSGKQRRSVYARAHNTSGTERFVYTPPVGLDQARSVQLKQDVTITMPDLWCEQ